MRLGFETWAQSEGQIVRRREDKPDEYLVLGTHRQWQIWQAACAHVAAAAPVPVGAQALRQRMLDEISSACKQLDPDVGIDGVLKLIEGLKAKA